MRIVLYLQIVLIAVSLVPTNIHAQGGDKNVPKVIKMDTHILNPLNPVIMIPSKKIVTVETACKSFAEDSIKHNDWQEKQKCGLTGSEWSSDYQYHYDRCIKGQTAQNEYRKRQESIAGCICKPYALDAVRQNDENLDNSCGYEYKDPRRWDSEYAHHYDWCARGGGNIIESGTWKIFSDAREMELTKCKKPIGPTNLQPNGGMLKKSDLTLTWQDPAAGKPNSAKEFNIEVYVNGKKKGFYTTASKKHIIRKDDLSNSANVSWRVRGKNSAGYSLWSDANFSIKKTPIPPPSPTGGINGTFFFDGSSGTQPFTITVKFSGAFISGPSTSGKKTFFVTKTKKMYPFATATVSFSKSGLAKGKWSISASSNMTGSVTCKAIVPGFVKLNVIGGSSCN